MISTYNGTGSAISQVEVVDSTRQSGPRILVYGSNAGDLNYAGDVSSELSTSKI